MPLTLEAPNLMEKTWFLTLVEEIWPLILGAPSLMEEMLSMTLGAPSLIS